MYSNYMYLCLQYTMYSNYMYLCLQYAMYSSYMYVEPVHVVTVHCFNITM